MEAENYYYNDNVNIELLTDGCCTYTPGVYIIVRGAYAEYSDKWKNVNENRILKRSNPWRVPD